MRLKQSQEEYLQNLNAAAKKILPAALSETPEGAHGNGLLLANWLRKNCAEGDVIDASVVNIISAIVALDKAGLIDWKVPPTKKPAKPQPAFLQTNEGRAPNHARESQVSEINITMAQEKQRREKLGEQEHGKIMAEAAALVRNHSAYPHSRRIRETTALKAEFDRLVASKVHPKEVLAGVKALQNSFTGADITRPKIAGV